LSRFRWHVIGNCFIFFFLHFAFFPTFGSYDDSTNTGTGTRELCFVFS